MLKVAAVFSDHMVLQRQRPVAVFGEADDLVTATLDVVRTEALPVLGRFKLTLPPMPAGGPYELKLTCGDETVTFTDVMVGEVWLCGGQSNMEFLLKDGKGGAAEAAVAEDAGLRFYTVNEEADVDAAMLERERATSWKPLAPGTCGDVSAVAYYAGRRLREALGTGDVTCELWVEWSE
jgi:sialate O-acetylesterase